MDHIWRGKVERGVQGGLKGKMQSLSFNEHEQWMEVYVNMPVAEAEVVGPHWDLREKRAPGRPEQKGPWNSLDSFYRWENKPSSITDLVQGYVVQFNILSKTVCECWSPQKFQVSPEG